MLYLNVLKNQKSHLECEVQKIYSLIQFNRGIQFNIQDVYKIMNELDPNLQFSFEELTKNMT